jgi:hypothetical protein
LCDIDFTCEQQGKEENVAAVVSAGAIVPLLDTLELPAAHITDTIRERRKLLEAVTRALKAIFASSRVSKHDVFTVSTLVYSKYNNMLTNTMTEKSYS